MEARLKIAQEAAEKIKYWEGALTRDSIVNIILTVVEKALYSNYTAENARLKQQLLAAQAEIAIFRKNWPKTHKAIRSDIMLAEAAEEIHALYELSKSKADLSALDTCDQFREKHYR